jgi:diguanylate cyclase (GGDEF)-like protein/PAS domain S-box-containing protein
MRLSFLVSLGAVTGVSLTEIGSLDVPPHVVVSSWAVLLALFVLRVVEHQRMRPVAAWIDLVDLIAVFSVLVQVRDIDAVLGTMFFLALFRSAVSRLARLVPILVGYSAAWLTAAGFAPEIKVYPGALVSLGVVGLMVYYMRVLLLRLQEQHQARSARLGAMLRRLPYPVIATDQAGDVVLANPAALDLIGWSSEAAGSLVELQMIDSGGRPIDLRAIAAEAARAGVGSGGIEVKLTRPDGSTSNIMVQTVPMAEESAPEEGVIIALLDISAQRMYEETLHHAAYHDPLTGLPNRALLGQHLDDVGRGTSPYGILLIDLNDFKTVNDTLGHQIGDELLKAVAERLRAAAGDQALVARLGGDEFAVVISDASVEGTQALAAAMRATFDSPFDLSCGPLTGRGTVGLAVVEPGQSPDDVLAAADRSMYHSKPHTRIRRATRSGAAADPAGAHTVEIT